MLEHILLEGFLMKYIKGLGLPYMGSKRKLAPKIIDFIIEKNPNVKYIYDLFGGGGAVSFEALQRPQIKKVIYNEFNTGVVELLRKVKNEGVTDEFYQWIDRDTFHKHKGDNCWFGGLCKVIWSFGNAQSSYIFGKHIEDDKRLLHEIIINSCENSRKIFNRKHDRVIIPKRLLGQERLKVTKHVKKYTGRTDLQQLEQLQRLQQLERLQQLQQLERLQQLQRLERLQQLERFDIHNHSYEDVLIDTPVDETIIYLDPPYKGTEKYQFDIDHDALFEWVKKSKYKVYMSSYECEDLVSVFEVEHRSTLSAKNNKKVSEKLFISKHQHRLEKHYKRTTTK